MKTLILTLTCTFALLSLSVIAGDIIPVKAWPKALTVDGKGYYNPSVELCVKAGYRLLTDKPATPAGKKIKSQEIVQDDKDSTKAKWVIVYEDLPGPEVYTSVPLARLVFECNTNAPGSPGRLTYDDRAQSVSKTNAHVDSNKVLFIFSTNSGVLKGIKYK